MKTAEEKLRNSIGMQLQFYTHSGETIEDTIDRIYNLSVEYASQKAPDQKHQAIIKQRGGTLEFTLDGVTIDTRPAPDLFAFEDLCDLLIKASEKMENKAPVGAQKCGKCEMLGDAAPCDECYRNRKSGTPGGELPLIPTVKQMHEAAISYAENECKNENNFIVDYAKRDFIAGAEWYRKESLTKQP